MDELAKFFKTFFKVVVRFVQLLDFILQLLVAEVGTLMVPRMVVALDATN